MIRILQPSPTEVGFSRCPEESLPGDTRVGGCGKGYLWRQAQESTACPRAPSVPCPSISLRRRSSFAFIGARNRTSVQTFCAMPRLVQSGLSRHPASPAGFSGRAAPGAVFGDRGTAGPQAAAVSTWLWLPWRECTEERGEPVLPRARKKGQHLFRLRFHCLGLGMDQELFQSNQSTAQAFAGCSWVHLLANLLPRPSRAVSLTKPAPCPGWTVSGVAILAPTAHVQNTPFIVLPRP